MILCNIADTELYLGIHPGIAKALEWLKEHEKDSFTKGIIEIGDGIVVKVEEPALILRENAHLEAHQRYIDIHVPLKGTETIGWGATRGLKHVRLPYNEENDVAFFGDSADSMLHVKVGQLAVFFPEDAHAPNIGLGNHKKLCIKIPR